MVQGKSIQEMELFGTWFAESSKKKTVCGQLKGGKKHKETWWWNEKFVEFITRKKEGYKKWSKDRSEENLEAYKVLKKEARREVASVMEIGGLRW